MPKKKVTGKASAGEAVAKLKSELPVARQKAKVKALPKKAAAAVKKAVAAQKPAAKKPATKKMAARKGAVRPAVAGVMPPLAASLADLPKPDATVLDRLAATVLSRRGADPAVSHSARLMARGTAKVAQKFGEEAVECLIEAVTGDHDALVAESADVLYHLIVLWVNAGIAPAQVWDELHRREGVSGIAEKARRKILLPTTKIP